MDMPSLKSLGELLRQKRKELNVSLKEVENATSIRVTYLQARQDGEMQKLLSPVYAQGFFKQYAAFLGLDGESLVRENYSVFLRPEAQEFAYGIGTLEMRNHPGDGIKWFPNLLWMVAFFSLLALSWYAARYFELL